MKTVVSQVVAKCGREKDKVIPVLQELQKRLNYIPSEALKEICRLTEITPGQISGVSTFYSQFRHIPAGKHIIKICAGTACHVKGSGLITEAFRRELKLDETTSTSADGLFSIEEVACLGCCTLAPVVQIDGKTYGHVKSTQAAEILYDFINTGKHQKDLHQEVAPDVYDAEVRIGLGSCCVAGGSREILSRLFEVKEAYDLNIKLKPVGCVGVCNQTPLLEIVMNDSTHHRYTNVKIVQVEDILLKHIKPGKFGKRLIYRINDFADSFVHEGKLNSPINLPGEKREEFLNNFLSYQVHIATQQSGILTPDSLDEYILLGGFEALKKVLRQSDKSEIADIILESGLRGRGGAGFPTGKKWKIFSESPGSPKYVVCNGDEGDPGAFMDRMLLESFPFRVIEGMMIAGFATGASEGIFYIRAEYPLAVSRVSNALKICYERGMLGDNILNTTFSFNITIFEGAGAFVCGEETALIASLEGKRGTPILRPPYPAVQGFREKPTLVNNVETLSLVPWIINNGPEAFSSIGTEKSKGTKVFALAGKVARGGLIEVPMGITIRDIVEKIGYGVGDGRTFKAVQIGGPSGGCIPASMADTPIDYEELSRMGAMMGSGGLVVLDDTDCMVDMTKYFLTFTHKQSCGKCTFCRVGTRRMLDILTLLSQGKADMKEIDELEKLSFEVRNGSLCGLGKTAPNPLITGLKYFREEFEAHARGYCPARKCRDLIKYVVNDKCTGCTKCSQDCPVGAIPFSPYEIHVIDQDLCIKCDNCRITCPEDAIEIVNIADVHKNQ
ncbi:MAG: NAD(P)H-dependent oxidoreductase subunit E [Bacteroidales bacterium]|nr:NAD(P)H-dependent oxidoreductase subunit E [Bacteroidales bacterium]MBN2632085.1 NAD(P)H-dependent oxidoreductase subunit E [Bacteroidales bacterium]